MFDVITIGSATRDVFLTSRAMHPHRAKDVLTHIEACFPFGAKINIDEIHFDTGGGATNNAVTFARLGKFRVAAFCRLGADSAGQDIVRALAHDRVNTSLIQTARNEQTAYSTIISPGGEVGERTILVYRGASERFNHSRIPWQKMKARWFYVSSLGGDLALLKKILAHAKRIGAQVAWNPGGAELSQLPPPLKVRGGGGELWQLITFLILNREESSRLTGVRFEDTKGLLSALAHITPSVIMTDGPKGAYAILSHAVISSEGRRPKSRDLIPYLYAGGEISPRASLGRNDKKWAAYYVPSLGHQPRNLTGAGDAFGSGFVTGWIKSRSIKTEDPRLLRNRDGDIQYALRLASFNADSVVQHVGAKVGILKKFPPPKDMTRLPVRAIRL